MNPLSARAPAWRQSSLGDPGPAWAPAVVSVLHEKLALTNVVTKPAAFAAQ